MEITLTPDIEQALADEARRLGTAPEILALDILRERLAPPASHEMPRAARESLADFLSGQIGVLHSGELVAGGARMSEDGSRKFAALLIQRRQRQG